jgi:hypothetical protein
MDSTCEILEAHYPRTKWARLRTHWAGRSGAVVVAVFPVQGGWQADGQLGPGRLVHHGEGADMHAALASLARCAPAYADMLHPTPYEQPQSTPFPPLLLRGVWAALWPDLGWLLLVAAMALACGALGMWTITGGAP